MVPLSVSGMCGIPIVYANSAAPVQIWLVKEIFIPLHGLTQVFLHVPRQNAASC